MIMDEELKKKLVEYVSRYEWDMAGLSVWIDYAKIGEFADYFSENSTLVDSNPGLHAYVQVDAVCILYLHQCLRGVGFSFREIVDMFPDGTSGHWIMRYVEWEARNENRD